MSEISFVGVDWGSTNFRAWAFQMDGALIAERNAPIGLKSVNTAGGFEAAFNDQCRDWLDTAPDAFVLFCGMVGARGGWKEAPYAACPVNAEELLGDAVRFRIGSHGALILPGATCQTDSASDVMRGEELQILGAAHLGALSDARFCIPGTHCKWACMEAGRLTRFSTYVTGELFQLLRHQSLLGRLAVGDDFDESAFKQGIDRGMQYPLSHALFAARANTLMSKVPADAASAYLSGILVGAEIGAEPVDGQTLILLASGEHASRYAMALEHAKRPFRLMDADEATRAGLVLLANRLRCS